MKSSGIRPITTNDINWITSTLKKYWGSTKMVTRRKIHDASQLPGFMAIHENEPTGLITYQIDNDECEIITLNSLKVNQGIGSALVDGVKDIALSADCKRLWLITTNDNTAALRFYQKRGFIISAIYPDAIAQSRHLKPEIPLIGIDGIPIRDEIELELFLSKEATN